MRRRFAMVFQKYALLDSMTVFDNVAFPLREETRMPESEIRERVHLALRELEVDDAAKKLPGELSGGMAKRVGIARAVVTEPELLVYDEPTSGLDPVGSRVVDGLIERMRERHCVTSLVITHDMVTAYEVADRVVLLAHGKVLAQGTPEQLFREHGGEIEPFALSSGIDLARLAPRTSRKSPAEISARWDATHPPKDMEEHGWKWPWTKRLRARPLRSIRGVAAWSSRPASAPRSRAASRPGSASRAAEAPRIRGNGAAARRGSRCRSP